MRWLMQVTSAPTRSQRASRVIAALPVIATTFVMHAMVGRQSRQLKMPRPDAYALTAHLQDGRLPVDNNYIENLMRPWAMGRKAWLFCGSELAGQRAAVMMSLVVSTAQRARSVGLPQGRADAAADAPEQPHRWQPQG